MFPLPISVYVCIFMSLSSAYVMHHIDGYYSEKEKLEMTQHALEHETKVVSNQAIISQTTQKDKDDLQAKYDVAVAELRGLRQSNSSSTRPTTFAIPSKGLRLLESDAEFLEQFAKECSNTELERNDVINKYNALNAN